jgi:hypothetical protein
MPSACGTISPSKACTGGCTNFLGDHINLITYSAQPQKVSNLVTLPKGGVVTGFCFTVCYVLGKLGGLHKKSLELCSNDTSSELYKGREVDTNVQDSTGPKISTYFNVTSTSLRSTTVITLELRTS